MKTTSIENNKLENSNLVGETAALPGETETGILTGENGGGEGFTRIARIDTNSVAATSNGETRDVDKAMAARRRMMAELTGLRRRLAENSVRLAELERSGDINDAAVLGEIGRLQVLAGLLPGRIAAREVEDENSEEDLTAAVNQFIREHLNPRVRRLIERTRAVVEGELAPHFRDRAALRVRKVESLAWSVTAHPVRGAMEHAEGALKSWAMTEQAESTV
jgi:hypothetical protein